MLRSWKCAIGFPVLLMSLARLAFGQIDHLATTDDGSVLLFQSGLRLADTWDGPASKIFRWDGEFSLLFDPPSSPADLRPGGATSPVISGLTHWPPAPCSSRLNTLL